MSYSEPASSRPSSYFFRQRQLPFGNRQLQRAKGKPQPFAFRPGQRLALPPVINPENLIRVWDKLTSDGGEAPGPDGLRYTDLGRRERADLMRELAKLLRTGNYRPQPPRIVQLAKPSGGFRELKLRTVVDRAVSRAVTTAISPVIDATFLASSLGFRPNRSVKDLVTAVNATVADNGNVILLNGDIRQAFDNLPVAAVVDAFWRHMHDEPLRRLVESILRGHEGASRRTGIDQGDALSPLGLNTLLDFRLDRPLVAACPGIPLWRYADNLVGVHQSVSDGRRVLDAIRRHLSELGLSLKGNPEPINLRRQGAHTAILGYDVSLGPDGHLRWGIPAGSWVRLREQLQQATLSWKPHAAAKQVTDGWQEYYGWTVGGDAERQRVRERLTRVLQEEGLGDLALREDVFGSQNRSCNMGLQQGDGGLVRGWGAL